MIVLAYLLMLQTPGPWSPFMPLVMYVAFFDAVLLVAEMFTRALSLFLTAVHVANQ